MEDKPKLIFQALQHYYIDIPENEKIMKLKDILNTQLFDPVIIFVKSIPNAVNINKILLECNFQSILIHSGQEQDEKSFVCLKMFFFLIFILLEIKNMDNSKTYKKESLLQMTS